MSSIDRIASTQEVARTYLQHSEISRSTAATASPPTTLAHQGHHAHTTDSVSLSDSARSLASAREAVQKAPDVRQQQVSQIKQQLSDGTYQVPARVLARKMLDQS